MIASICRGWRPKVRFRALFWWDGYRCFSFLAAAAFVVGGSAGSRAQAQTLPGVTWTTSTQKPKTGASPQSIAVGDFNGDGFADLAVAQAGSIGVFLGNGDGTFKPADVGNDGMTIQASLSGTMAIAAAAFQSGKPDGIIVVSGTHDATILSSGTGGEMAPNSFSGVGSCTSVATGAFVGGGNQGFVVAGLSPGSQSPVLGIYLGAGNGTFGAPTLIPIDTSTPVFVAAVSYTHLEGKRRSRHVDRLRPVARPRFPAAPAQGGARGSVGAAPGMDGVQELEARHRPGRQALTGPATRRVKGSPKNPFDAGELSCHPSSLRRRRRQAIP